MPYDFDFKYDEHTDSIQRLGHFSFASNREATREEALMWGRIQELERLIEDGWPPSVRPLLEQITTPPVPSCVELGAVEMANLQTYAAHYVTKTTDPNLTRKQILGSIPIVVDGVPTTIWLKLNPNIPNGSIVRIDE